MQRKSDFTIIGGGTVYLLRPNTKRAEQWVREHIPADAQYLGNAVAVEHRYIGDIAEGIRNDGYTIRAA
jgi:hypothetical protein